MMRCVKCNEYTKISDTRMKVYDHKQTVYRRRVCLTCKHKFSTIEHIKEFKILGHHVNKKMLRKEVQDFVHILTILMQHCVNEDQETLIILAKKLAGEADDNG